MPGPEPFADIPDEPLLNIKAVSQSTNIEPVTLRAWERRYGVPKPARSEQGYRLYSERDVAILRWLKSKVDAGVKIKQAVAMLRTQAPQSLPHTSPLRAIPSESTNLEAMAENMLDAAHEFDAARVQQIISQAFALFPVEDVCLDLLLPVLQEVGHEWRTGAASLHVEHFLTNLIRQQVLALDAAMPLPSRRGKVVAGCAPGDLHEMGVLILAMILRRRGWEVVYLGQAVGTDRLEDALEAIQPDVVVMASSALESLGDLPEAARIASRADSVAGRFVFGGTLFSSVPSLADRVPGIYGGDTLVTPCSASTDCCPVRGSLRPTSRAPCPMPSPARTRWCTAPPCRFPSTSRGCWSSLAGTASHHARRKPSQRRRSTPCWRPSGWAQPLCWRPRNISSGRHSASTASAPSRSAGCLNTLPGRT